MLYAFFTPSLPLFCDPLHSLFGDFFYGFLHCLFDCFLRASLAAAGLTDSKKLTAADHADVKLSDIPKPEGALSEDDTKKLTSFLKESLGARVEEVKASDRLVDSPALAVNADKFMSPQMRRMMKAMKKDGADEPVKVNLEINPRSAVMKRLFETHTTAPDRAKLVAEQILDNALISAGLLDDATPMVARLYKLLESV